MQTMMTFTTWLINQLPSFLLAEPICYFVYTAILVWIVDIILKLFAIK